MGRSTSNTRMGQVEGFPSRCSRCGAEGTPCRAGTVGKGPRGRHRSREHCLGKGCESVRGESCSTDKDPQKLLQLDLANHLSHSFEAISPSRAVILLLPFSHPLSLVI